MMRAFTILCISLLVVGLTGCHLSDIKPLINEEVSSYKGIYNESYGKDALQRFDIHYPVSVSGRPSEVLILLHGGAWSGGDKSYLAPTVDALQKSKKNLTIVNINYRLATTPTIRLEQQLADIQLLIDYLRQNISLYNITDGKFVIGGVSAGGHLALDYAYLKDPNHDIKSVVGIVAPTDLTSQTLREGGLEKPIQQLIGNTIDKALEEYRNASPIYNLTSSAPPTILFCGGKDLIVPQIQGELLKVKLNLLGVKNRYYFYPEETHDFSPDLLVDKILELY
ncbi:alpha/beta hydrolase [Runella sp.]|uniref:alpha/beta hydrolase n=1 Tax=Runella sp. TaxID=1960881 RepID=UPI00261C967E|nr:alpha/beta hydrolase [Runella sp.]